MQGRLVMTWPRKDRCTCWISPRPPQTSQVRREVPGWAPSPWQVEQTTAVSTEYGTGADLVAGLGVLGPTRMDYPTTMASVRAVATYVSRILAQ